jgi:glycerophosphoryl diester phosphodiesterase
MTPAWPYPRWIAHRGAGKLAPENTLAAFRLGASFGYRGFECDVKLSADGVPFLLHDTTLERTTNGQGVAGQLPWDALSRLDAGGWHSRTHAGEAPPSFEAVVRYMLRNGFVLNVEIKPTPGQERVTGEVVASHALRWWAAAQPGAIPPLFSSFKPEALAGARHAAPDLPRALLLETLREGWLDEALGLGCVAVVADHTVLDAGSIGRIQQAGLRALCYTVNETADAQRLLAAGIDGLITDAVDRFAPAADDLQLR